MPAEVLLTRLRLAVDDLADEAKEREWAALKARDRADLALKRLKEFEASARPALDAEDFLLGYNLYKKEENDNA